MRGQLVSLASGVGRVLVYMLILFAVIGAILNANLVDNTNPFYDTWTQIKSYANTAFILVGVSLIVIVGYWALRHLI